MKAWEIARKGVRKFGGNVKQYLAQALKMAWAIAKKAERVWVGKFEDVFARYYDGFRNKGIVVNKWEKHNKRRIYFNDYNRNTLGFMDFDEEGYLITTKEEMAVIKQGIAKNLIK